jgi:LPS-assembly lipoprotein
MLFRYLILICIAFIISACGFHLRGSGPGGYSAISSLYIVDSNASNIGENVRSQLALSGTEITDSSNSAQYALRLYGYGINQSVLSVSALTGKVEEFQLSMSVRMTLTDSNNNELLSNQLIRITRDYAFDERTVLGSESERALLIDEMTRQSASQIIRRLLTVIR